MAIYIFLKSAKMLNEFINQGVFELDLIANIWPTQSATISTGLQLNGFLDSAWWYCTGFVSLMEFKAQPLILLVKLKPYFI